MKKLLNVVEDKLNDCKRKLKALDDLHESWKNDGTGFYDLFVK